MIPNIYCLKPYKDKQLNAFALWLRERRISANMITVAGLIAGLSGAACLFWHNYGLGLTLLGLSIGSDMLDGTVARLEQCQTLSGKIFDSVCDRFVEAAWIGALIIIGFLNVWAFMLAVGSVSLFLCRVLAHRLGLNSSKVTVTRFERIAALITSTVFQGQVFSRVIFMMVTIGTFFSCFQIILMIVRRTLNIRNASRPLI